jgi:hypothetical protein
MHINEFLLARVADDEAGAGAPGSTTYELGPNRAHACDLFERRRIAIHRHHDRSVTVMFAGRAQTISRCGVCAHELTRPCRALKRLALPHASHPDYDAAWSDLAAADA